MKKSVFISVLLGVFALALSIGVSLARPWTVAVAVPPEDGAVGETPEAAVPPPLRSGETIRVLDGEAVVEMGMNEYLVGAVAAEMPVLFEPDALAAQAVAVRTYVLHNMLVAPSAAHPDADVCTDFTDCLAYTHDEELRERWGGDYEANLAKITAAVAETDGVYLEYGGEPILAAFHSSSFGKTEDAERVWHKPLPYLVSVPSPETEEDTPNLVSSVTLSIEEFRSVVAAHFPSSRLAEDRTKWVTDVVSDESGRVASLKLGGVEIDGITLRAAFGLRSAAVTVEVGKDVTFTTRGNGHGVGMSQYGANAMAKNGSGWREILTAYYTGAKISAETENL